MHIGKGEFVSIMGPSGSGKSTMMNIIGCLDRPSEGRYTLNGRRVEAMTEDELAHVRNSSIGFVFQTFNLLTRHTAIENVELPLLYAGVKETKDRARAALTDVGLEKRLANKQTSSQAASARGGHMKAIYRTHRSYWLTDRNDSRRRRDNVQQNLHQRHYYSPHLKEIANTQAHNNHQGRSCLITTAKRIQQPRDHVHLAEIKVAFRSIMANKLRSTRV